MIPKLQNLLIKTFLVFILSTTTACAMTENTNSNPQEIFSKPINFKDYKNVKSLEKHLNETYPAGSDAGKMVEDMKKAGAKCATTSDDPYKNDPRIKNKNLTFCKIYGAQFLSDWNIDAEKNDDGTVKSIKVWAEYSGL